MGIVSIIAGVVCLYVAICYATNCSDLWVGVGAGLIGIIVGIVSFVN